MAKHHDIGTDDYPSHARRYIETHCGIEQARRAGITYVSADECKYNKLPKVNGSHHDALYIPQSDGSYSIRFLPRKGESDPEPRFKRESGSKNSFYLPPLPKEYRRKFGHWRDIRKDTNRLIYFVEGPIKANTLAPHGLVPIGLHGTYGHISDGKPIKDFDDWNWRNRRVVICFDSDITQKPEVRQALARLAKHLASLGAKVRIKLLTDKRGEKVGPDDFVREHGAKAFRKLPSYAHTSPRFFDWDAPLVIQQMNAQLGFCLLKGRAVIVHIKPDPDYPGTTEAVLSKAHDTELAYANQKLTYTVTNSKGKEIEKSVPKFQYWLSHPKRRDIRQLILNPELPSGYDPASKDYNLWQGWGVNEHKPDESHSWELLKAHIRTVITRGDKSVFEYVLKSLAFWIQHPATLPEVALVLLGGQGTGKGTLFSAIVKLFGRHGIQLNTPRQVVGNFNDHLKDKLFIFADEALFAGDPRIVGVLHGLITEPTMSIEPKFQALFHVPNVRKFGIATNEQWAVPASIDARRFTVLEISEEHKQEQNYFGPIRRQLENGGLEAMLYELRRINIKSFHPRNELPKTTGLWDQKRLSFDPTTEWWFSCLVDGYIHRSDKRWIKTVPTEVVHSIVSENCDGHQRRALTTKIGMTLRKLCPQIEKRRASAEGERKAERSMHYMLPDLRTCRAAFERAVMQPIDWRSGDARNEDKE